MKYIKTSSRDRRWLWALLLQIAASAAAGLAASASEIGPGWARILALWVAVPLIGGVTAFRAVTAGLLNYLAWIAPPALLYIAHIALWGYVPPVSAALLCAFVSLVGAAAGEVSRHR